MSISSYNGYSGDTGEKDETSDGLRSNERHLGQERRPLLSRSMRKPLGLGEPIRTGKRGLLK